MADTQAQSKVRESVREKKVLELGATHVVNLQNESVEDEVMKITGTSVHYSLETTSLPTVIREAVDCLTFCGTCGIPGASPFGTQVSLDVIHLMTAGRTVRGIVEGDSIPDLFIQELIEHYLHGRFPFDGLVRYYPFSEINRAIADSEAGRVIKPIFRYSE